jgi:hypothetical protein
MKRLLPILFAVSILLQSVANLTMVGSFVLNRDQIAQAFCINKSQPELKCNGKCYLAKKLRIAFEQEQSPQEPPTPVRVLPLTTPPVPTPLPVKKEAPSRSLASSDELRYESPVFTLFRPPWAGNYTV